MSVSTGMEDFRRLFKRSMEEARRLWLGDLQEMQGSMTGGQEDLLRMTGTDVSLMK